LPASGLGALWPIFTINTENYVNEIEIEGRIVSASRCLVIAEVAQTHDGSVGQAHAFIDAVARTGADAIKFQTHIADAESTPGEPWRVNFSPQDATRYDYWKRMEFSEEHWRGLREHASNVGLIFLSSPFSIAAVDLLERIGVGAWKIASGEVNNPTLFERIAETGRPVILSTGMSTLAEIDDAVARVRSRNLAVAVMQCTSMYPTPPEKVGLNLIPFFRERYECPVGLSDHSGTIYPGLAASSLGAAILEVHITLSREMFGPDVPVSLTISELGQMVEGVRLIEKMHSHPVDKDSMAAELTGVRDLFTKSVVARRNLAPGTVLTTNDLTVKKPGTGIPATRLEEVLGRKVIRLIVRDQLLEEGDLERVS
jgi:N,N'-diacetyllegionaminate synthase